MTIRSKISTGTISILDTDTVILQVVGRVGIESMNCFNGSANDVTVTFYVSQNNTSAGGVIVSVNSLSAGEELDINAIVAQGYTEGQYIIAVADSVGVNCSTSFTEFSGSDV